jgi:cysteine synthase A
MNPGGSVKDRPAFEIIYQAEKQSLIQKGGLIVDASAGNTGIGLSMVARTRGYRCLIVIPETQSEEKKQSLRMNGAELIEVPAVPYSNPKNYIHISKQIAEERSVSEKNGVLWANQFDNTHNMQAHLHYTAPELWQQTDGNIDAFVCAVGTGGTIAGVSQALKSYNPHITIALADPHGAAIFSHVKTGVLKSEGSSITEGIGQGRITENLALALIDDAFRIDDLTMLSTIHDLVLHEGLCLGGSSGINVAGAIALAKVMGPGHTIVTILCDSGARYASKLYNPEFLKKHQLPAPPWMKKS